MSFEAHDLDQIANQLKQGGVIVLPTDTVFGLATALCSPAGIQHLYEIKKRPASQPTAVLVSSMESIQLLSSDELDGIQKKILLRCWPGALTVIFNRTFESPFNRGLDLICGQEKKIGVRLPEHPLVLALIQKLGCPLVASSANTKGMPAPIRYDQIEPEILDKLDDAILGKTHSGIASTVLDFTQGSYRILREGTITAKMLAEITGLN